MKLLALLLSLSLPGAGLAQPPEPPPSAGELAPVTIKAPRPENDKTRHLKQTRAVGGLAAVSGLGVMTYAIFFASTGPVGWAAGLLFLGGMTAYLAHRALRGQDDFGPGGKPAGRPPVAEAAVTPPSR